jgi:2-methylisocitrate lyase-like PEP mutase family enzyme
VAVSQEEKAERFASLHSQSGFFVIPNPWDIGSARILEGIGFQALATTSSGFAQTLGRIDGQVSLEEKLHHCEELASSTDVPISADMENCFGDDPEDVALCIRLVAATGVVGASIEDFTGDPLNPIYELSLAVDRVAAAVEVAGSLPFKFMITARAEQLLRVGDDLDATIKRLLAYEAAGADVLYAPALKTLDEVGQVADAVNSPINVLGSSLPAFSTSEIGEAGARRISVGGGLARLVAGVLFQAGTALHDDGDLSWVTDISSGKEVDSILK